MRYLYFPVHLRHPRRALTGHWDTKTKLAAVLMTDHLSDIERRDWSYEQGLFPCQLTAWRRVAAELRESDSEVVQKEFAEARKIVALRLERKVIVPFPHSVLEEDLPEQNDAFYDELYRPL